MGPPSTATRAGFFEKKCYSGREVIRWLKKFFIIASRDFRDPEYFVPKEILENAGIEVKTASSLPAGQGPAVGAEGGEVWPDLSIGDAKSADYDGVIFVGGAGSQEYFQNPQAHKLVQEAFQDNKLLAAICIAPSILANAGVLKDKKVTAFSSEEANLKKQGAQYTGATVEADNHLITANGPAAAQEFGEKIVEALK